MKFVPMVALMAMFSVPSFAQDAPAGARATSCDASRFTAVRSERTGEILYWNNSTCTAPRSGSSMDMDGMRSGTVMSDGMMGNGMSRSDMTGGDMSDCSMMN